MTRYTVVWTVQTSDKVAELWLNNPRLRPEITEAVDDIDRRLAFQPNQVGEPFSKLARYVVCPPLSVLFRVLDDDAIGAGFSCAILGGLTAPPNVAPLRQ